MSCWGVSIFQDRDAMDLLEEILNGGKMVDDIRSAFSIVIDDYQEYTEYEMCCEAVLGAELVAASMGNISKHFPGQEYFEGEYTEGVKINHPDWDELSDFSNKDLRLLAIEAIKTILTSDHCEYLEFWNESEHYDEWVAEMNDLLERLQ